MGWRDWFGGLFDDDSTDTSSSSTSIDSNHDCSCTINPATGLPMMGGCGGVDVAGNPYGMSSSTDTLNSSDPFSYDWMDTTSSISDDWSSSSAFDDSWHSSSFDN